MRSVRLILAVATLSLLAGWQVFDRQSRPPPLVKLPPASNAVVARQAFRSSSPQASALVDTQDLQHPGQTEVCGLGWVDIKADEGQKAVLGQKLGVLAGKARHETAALLLNDPDAFARAVGLLVHYLADADDLRRASSFDQRAEACVGTDCPEFRAQAAAAAELANQLALQAVQTLDPRVYSLAYQTCSNTPSHELADACSLLSTQQWARIDPDNGVPWLYTLLVTTDKNTAAMVDEALFHIAKAKRYDDRFFAVTGEIARHAGTDDLATLGAFAASVDALGISAALPLPLYKLLGACRAAALDDFNRRQLCEGAAEALADRSDTFLMASVGVSIGGYLGWEPRRRDALRGLQQALVDATAQQFGYTRDEAVTSCGGLKSLLQRFARQAVIGEMGWVREWLGANGKTEEAYTQRAREGRLQREAEKLSAAAIAAAAATASASSRQPR